MAEKRSNDISPKVLMGSGSAEVVPHAVRAV